MRFLADMGVSPKVVEWLKEQGYNATHIRDEGLQRLPNGTIFEKAAAESRVLLTFDLDFGEILALSHGGTVSVVLFRLSNPRTEFVINRLKSALQDSWDALEKGAIVVVENTRHRVRHLPLGG